MNTICDKIIFVTELCQHLLRQRDISRHQERNHEVRYGGDYRKRKAGKMCVLDTTFVRNKGTHWNKGQTNS